MDPAVVESLGEQLRRPAIVMEIGGFRPPEGLGGSWFGRVNLALPGEGWPESDGKPLHALAQIDLTQLPFRPPHLEDVAMITLFIGDVPPYDTLNGDGWCLRAYPDLAQLAPLAPVDTGSRIKPFPMRPSVIAADHPSWEDVEIELPEEIDADYNELFPTADGFKLGGWPVLVQSEIEWPRGQGQPRAAEYVFQVDSTEKGHWYWGDGGVGYFGRGTAPGERDRWTLAWQCY
jgi:hypothetical protein